ncbi:MAG: hypothetical protein N3A38_16400, partial [Planctomycetota bacterium]|nr:hypothetical protein [Planctomycetota bacterium]
MATVSRILARVCLGAILAVQACTFALGAGKATAAEESGRLDAGGEDAASVAAGREAMREENAGAETKGGPGREKRAGKAFMKVEGGPGPDGKAFPVDGGGQEAASPAGKAAERKEAAEQRHYADAEAGYSLKIPDGWRKVTEREVREVFRGMLKAFGKKAVEAVLQRPPVFFEGPNPRDPMKIWENFGVGHIPTTFTLDPDRLDEYRSMVERQLKSEETPYEDVRVSLARVSGILSLRID